MTDSTRSLEAVVASSSYSSGSRSIRRKKQHAMREALGKSVNCAGKWAMPAAKAKAKATPKRPASAPPKTGSDGKKLACIYHAKGNCKKGRIVVILT